MCYAKPGNRCSAYENQRKAAFAKELAETEEAQEALRQEIKEIKEAGGTASSLMRKLKANIDKVAALKVANENAKKAWLKTTAGIAHLREQAADESLTQDQRELNRLKADRYEAEAAKARNAVLVARERETALRNDLDAAGVPAKTVEQVMAMKPETTFGSSIVSSSTAYKNWKQAEKNFSAITKEAKAAEAVAQKNGTPEELAAVIQKYSVLRAEAKERVDMNTAAYFTTPAGIQELLDTADAATKRSEKGYYRNLAASYQHARDTRLEGNNLRRRRESAIREAMISVGKDPDAAIKAYRKNRKISTTRRGPAPKTADLAVSVPKATCLTHSEYTQLANEAESEGMTVKALIRHRALGKPTTHMNGNVREVLAAAPKKPKGTGHRNTTVEGERRNVREVPTFTPQEGSMLRSEAKTFNMTVSSLMRAKALGFDVRMLARDRSDIANHIKSENMILKHATPAESARTLAA